MTLITKPDFTYVWASGGAIVAPNDTKKQQGWVAEAPPFQYDNWLQNRQDQMLAHINQRGIPAWDALTEYEAGGLSYTQGSDGKVYKSVAASGPGTVVQNPTTDGSDTYWTIAFTDLASGDTRYTQRANNLSDLANTATARANIGAAPIASPAFTGTPTAPNQATGTRSTAIATMQKFADEFGSSLAANGYQKLPSGWIIQWGSALINTTATTITFPVTFPAALVVRGVFNNSSTTYTVVALGATTSNMISMANAPGQTCNWIAIGY